MTAPLIPTPWIDNTGTVPDGVEADTVIEVKLKSGIVLVWQVEWPYCNEPCLWEIVGDENDVIRWRKVQP